MAVKRLTELEELSNMAGDIIEEQDDNEEFVEQGDDTEDLVVKTAMLNDQGDESKQLNDQIETNSDRPRY